MSDRQVVTLSASSLDRMQLCLRQYKFSSVDGWTPKVTGERIDMGSYMHLMLEKYYQARIDGKDRDVFEIIAEAHPEFVGDSFLEPGKLDEVERLFIEYVGFWGSSDGWIPLYAEQPFTKVLFEDEKWVFVIQGKIDLVCKTPYHELLIVDHKLVGRNNPPPILSNQNMAYSWAFNTPNVMINRVGTQGSLKTKEKLTRVLRSYPAPLIEEWEDNILYWVKYLIFSIEHNHFPPNFTSCDKYSGCFYRDVCSQIPKAREWKLGQKFQKRKKFELYKPEASSAPGVKETK